MKTRFSGILKWLALAGFLLAAGSFYSCGFPGPGEVGLVRAEENVEPVAQEEPVSVSGQDAAAGGSTGETASGAVSDSTETASGAAKMPGVESPTEAQPRTIYIYICGEILHPGVYQMAEGQRIFEVVERAGGFTELAADSWLNLAETVYDGMKIEVPNENQEQDAAWLAAHTAGGSQTVAWSVDATSGLPVEEAGTGNGSGKVNINTATKEQLMTLTGIGEVKAASIVQYRNENGSFRQIEDIMNVPGIKDAAFQKIKDEITI